MEIFHQKQRKSRPHNSCSGGGLFSFDVFPLWIFLKYRTPREWRQNRSFGEKTRCGKKNLRKSRIFLLGGKNVRFFSLFFQNWKARCSVENLNLSLWKTLWKLCKTKWDKRLARVEISLCAVQKHGCFGKKKRRFFNLSKKVFQSAKKAWL